MRKFMPSAAQPLPFQTPTDLLDVHDTLCWWFISYLAACSNIFSLDTSDSEGVSSSLLGKGNSRRDSSGSLWCSLAQRSYHLLMSGQVLVFKICFSFLCAAETHTAISSPQRRVLGTTRMWKQERPCVSHRCIQVELHFSSCSFCCWEAVPELLTLSSFFGFFAPGYQNTDLG